MCDAVIRSVEIQLVRIETVGQDSAFTKEATEVQNIQIADGDPPRGIPISIHMVCVFVMLLFYDHFFTYFVFSADISSLVHVPFSGHKNIQS
jgi:hypothetical protein